MESFKTTTVAIATVIPDQKLEPFSNVAIATILPSKQSVPSNVGKHGTSNTYASMNPCLESTLSSISTGHKNVAIGIIIPQATKDTHIEPDINCAESIRIMPSRNVNRPVSYCEDVLPLNDMTEIRHVDGKGDTLWSSMKLPSGQMIAIYNFEEVSRDYMTDYIERNGRNRDKCVEIEVGDNTFCLIGNRRYDSRGVILSNACPCVSNCDFMYDLIKQKDPSTGKFIQRINKCWLETIRSVEKGEELTWCYRCPWDWVKDHGVPSRKYMYDYVCPMSVCGTCPFKEFDDNLKLPPYLRSSKFSY